MSNNASDEFVSGRPQGVLAEISRKSFVKGAFTVATLGGLGVLAGCNSSIPQNSSSSSASSSSTKTEDKKTYRVGMEVAYAPYNWQTDKETDYTIPVENVPNAYADGYDIQIAKAIMKEMGAEAVAVKMAFSGLIDALQQGQIDLIIAGMSKTPERAQSIDFSDPYYVGTYGVLVRKDSKYANAKSLEDLSGAAVLGQKDTLLDTVIDEIPGVNHLTPVDSVPNQIASLEQGVCDAITYEAANMKSILKSHDQLAGVIFEKGKGFKDEIYCNVGVAKGNSELVEKINKALATISDDQRDAFYQEAMERQPE